MSAVNNPAHYGGADNPYEAIKVIEACKCGFHIGNALKYLSRAGKKEGETALVDLQKAVWYLKRMLATNIRSGFIRTSNNPFNPLEVANAWGLKGLLADALNSLWWWNIETAIAELEEVIETAL